MKLAIIFWFYKELEICENRLQILKKYNPDLKIFGLYGGEISKAEEYQEKLGRYLDDFYVFTASTDEDWKWINGDLMILDWYDQRGRDLEWDSVAVIQWDMLVFDSLLNQLQDIKKDEVFLSGLRILDSEVENSWSWTMPGSEDRQNYLNFINYISEHYGYIDKPLCCLFILGIFPKLFFDKYLTVSKQDVGMLEYKIPTYAKMFGILFYEKDLGVKWFSKDELPLNAIPEEIQDEYINKELLKINGWRIFHPYFKKWGI